MLLLLPTLRACPATFVPTERQQMHVGDERQGVDVQCGTDLLLLDGYNAHTRSLDHRLISWARVRASPGSQPIMSPT
jgi:hypothetical protein